MLFNMDINQINLKSITDRIEQNNKLDIKNKEDFTYKEKLLEKLTESYDKEVAKQKDNIKFITNLIDILEQNLGQEINKLNTSLVNNIYILDHDHLGNSLDKPFMITEKDKVIFKEDHPIFKCDVLVYNYYKNAKIDVFYDAISHILLGYKECY